MPLEDSDAKQELRRADHLIFVSLKYTKTVDVIKSIIKRLINAYEISILHGLEYLQKKGRFEDIPLSPGAKSELFNNLNKRKKEILDFMELYFMLKYIDKADYIKKEEYRKNLAMIVVTEEGKSIEINVVKIREFYEKTREFVKYIEENYSNK